MKNHLKIVSFLLLLNMTAFAQKEELKEAQANYAKGKNQEALAILKKIEYQIINAPDDVKTEYFFTKGNVCKDLAAKNTDAATNFSLAVSAYQDVLLYENESRVYKFAFKASSALKEMKSKLVDGAYNDYKAGKFKESSDKSYEVYLFDKKDTLNLYNAASSSLSAKDYTTSIKYFEQLKKINYTGKGMLFYATNKKTKEEESFTSISAREISVKEGLYEKPRNFYPPSKKDEILTSLGYAFLENNDYCNAEKYYEEALQTNEKCMDCYINLVYVKIEQKKQIVDKMAALGNSPSEMKQYDVLDAQKDEIIKSAIPYLKKALTIEPKNESATKSLLGIYRSLNMTNEYNSLKSSM
ncbi:tetratricopeptide repeat protein [Flavobacterium sp. FlaQc-47]|uniref:tetratricopeptide repeat protein n=1 Tax=Flavobacterium sp. FlaQc-47 TaxID=3374180 RepID=UPI003757544A